MICKSFRADVRSGDFFESGRKKTVHGEPVWIGFEVAPFGNAVFREILQGRYRVRLKSGVGCEEFFDDDFVFFRFTTAYGIDKSTGRLQEI